MYIRYSVCIAMEFEHILIPIALSDRELVIISYHIQPIQGDLAKNMDLAFPLTVKFKIKAPRNANLFPIE